MSNSFSAASSTRAASSRRSMTSGGSVPRPVRRRTSSSQLGGSEEHQQRVGHGPADLPGALEVDLQEHRLALGEAFLDGPAGGAVAVPGELGPFEELPFGDEPVETGVVDEEVLHTIGLTRAGGPGGHRDRQPHPGV